VRRTALGAERGGSLLSRETKISELCFPVLVDENVETLDVTVDDGRVARVEVVHADGRREGDVGAEGPVGVESRRLVGDDVEKTSLVHVLCDETALAIRDSSPRNQDVGVLELPHRVDFLEEVVHLLLGDLGGLDLLDGDVSVLPLALPDFSKGT